MEPERGGRLRGRDPRVLKRVPSTQTRRTGGPTHPGPVAVASGAEPGDWGRTRLREPYAPPSASGTALLRLSQKHSAASTSSVVDTAAAASGETLSAYQHQLDQWDEWFRELDAFKAKHGHCNVPQKQGPLGVWVHSQRPKKGKLSEDRAQKLDDLGFNWGTRRGPRGTWDERLGALTDYKSQHGHCNIPQRQGPLGSWASSQRTGRCGCGL